MLCSSWLIPSLLFLVGMGGDVTMCRQGSLSSLSSGVPGGVQAFQVPVPVRAAAAAPSARQRRFVNLERSGRSVVLDPNRRQSMTTTSYRPGARGDDDHDGRQSTGPASEAVGQDSRTEARHFGSRWTATLLGCCVVGMSATFVASPPEANAAIPDSSPFFQRSDRPMLTSNLLEQYRIWDQEMADNLKYGGELERGDAANKGRVDAYPELLVPIVRMQNDLLKVKSLVSSSKNMAVGPDEWRQVQQIVMQPQYETKQFKTIFNAYGDNIYYSDPDRANLYLAGGATPKNEQSIAYLLRNDLLTAVQNLQVEVEYCLGHVDAATEDNDVAMYASQAADSLEHYLDLVPPRELDRARALLVEQQEQQ